ncbi:anoctamin-like protein [Achlya hypogyna]|uniref:Anoctamin-like protein n=1 Tax=Achlya hypogyna TaxID=1202772 RepID=A0A1V9YEZ1_ACHHY|nr:anoctamin-like protein [Achlya hypogyna]
MDLHEACESGNEERVVELLLSKEASELLRDVDAAGRSPLHAACIGGQCTVVELLLGRPALVYFPSRSVDDVRTLLEVEGGMTNVDVCIKRKEDELVPAAIVTLPPASIVRAADLIEGKLYMDHYGNAPIQCIACFGCGSEIKHIADGLAIATELLRSGCHCNTHKTSNHWTPLHWACFNGNHEMVQLLLDPAPAMLTGTKAAPQQYAIPLVCSREGFFPVDLAGRLALKLASEMRQLRALATDSVGAADEETEASHAFEYQQWRLRLDHVQTVLVLVADFVSHAVIVAQYAAACNSRSQPPAAAVRAIPLFTPNDVVRYGQHLLFWCAGLNLRDEVGRLLALHFSNGACLTPLFTVGMDDGRMHSALHFACAMGYVDMVRLLLGHVTEHGHTFAPGHAKKAKVAPSTTLRLDALPGWRNDRLETPLFVAVVHNHPSVVQVFLDVLSPAQRDVECKIANVEGATPQHVATEAVRRLLNLSLRTEFKFEYAMVFTRAHAAFRKTLGDVLEEESSRAPSAIVTDAGTQQRGQVVRDYITVGAAEFVIAERAEDMRIKLRRRGSLLREPFMMRHKASFEPFVSLHRQQVVLNIIRNNVNLWRHVQAKTIDDLFPLHEARGVRNIRAKWFNATGPKVAAMLREYVTEGQSHSYATLWPILKYFGEKPALYTAWSLFYTMWLTAIAPFGLIVESCSLAGYPGGVLYLAVVMSLSTTCMVEQWKRKRSELLCNWGLPQAYDDTSLSTEYHGDFVVNTTTNEMDVQFPTTTQRLRMLAGAPALATMGALAVVAFAAAKLATAVQAPVPDSASRSLLVSTGYAVVILVLDWAYTLLAYRLTKWENHRTYESMLAAKLFWFKFLNAFISLFSLAFVDQDFASLRTQLLTILIVRQLKNLTVNYVLPLLHVRYRWQKRGLKLADLFQYEAGHSVDAGDGDEPPPVPKGIEMQELMYPSDLLLNKHIDMMMQFGYVTMFVTVFPAGPFFAALHNLVEVRLDVQCSIEAKRRPFYDSDAEITTFMSILQFMSLCGIAAVTVNCALLYLNDDLDVYIDATWAPATTLKKVAVVLVLEHLLLGLKAVLALLISDMPTWVEQYYAALEQGNNSLIMTEYDTVGDGGASVEVPLQATDGVLAPTASLTASRSAPTKLPSAAHSPKRKLISHQKAHLRSATPEPVTSPVVDRKESPSPVLVVEAAPRTNGFVDDRHCAFCAAVDSVNVPATLKCLDCKVLMCAVCDGVMHPTEAALAGLPGGHVRVDVIRYGAVQADSSRVLAVRAALTTPPPASSSAPTTTLVVDVVLPHFAGSRRLLEVYIKNKEKLQS